MPLVGLAASFPWIENDEKIEYAVNQRFLDELDYVDELDEEELDEPLVTIVEENQQEEKEALWGEIKNMDGSWKPDFLQGVTSSRLSIVAKKEEGIPLVHENDIHRYYINPYIETAVINENIAQIDKGFIVTESNNLSGTKVCFI
ncbi:hypothetical protein [Chryseobacterium indoltheticum]|uniref:hypothetical protein n=1 Tax=Chryseobacterium indoltheticum TaxID=254 RepID=UPI003F4953BB